MIKPPPPFSRPRICSISPACEKNEGDPPHVGVITGEVSSTMYFAKFGSAISILDSLPNGGGSVRLAASGAMTEKLHPCAADISDMLTKLRPDKHCIPWNIPSPRLLFLLHLPTNTRVVNPRSHCNIHYIQYPSKFPTYTLSGIFSSPGATLPIVGSSSFASSAPDYRAHSGLNSW